MIFTLPASILSTLILAAPSAVRLNSSTEARFASVSLAPSALSPITGGPDTVTLIGRLLVIEPL